MWGKNPDTGGLEGGEIELAGDSSEPHSSDQVGLS